MLYFQGENCCKQENKPNWIPKAKHNSKTCETEKLIVNSLRLLHETFLYFEIGSNQVANNDNNFCNKIKHETNPHEFNNFATQEHFSYIFLYSLFYYAHTYILIRITQPTDFLPSNYINFYVRQLIINSKATKNAYVLNEQISKLHTQHTEWHVALPEQKNPPKLSKTNQKQKYFNSISHTESKQTKTSNDINKNNFYLFYFQTGMVRKMRRE